MRLGEYLDRNGISHRDFAGRIGVTSEAVRLWTSGTRHPRPDMLAKIREATNGEVEPNDFIAAAEEPVTPEAAD